MRHSSLRALHSLLFCLALYGGCLFSELPLRPEMAKSSASGHRKSLTFMENRDPLCDFEPKFA